VSPCQELQGQDCKAARCVQLKFSPFLLVFIIAVAPVSEYSKEDGVRLISPFLPVQLVKKTGKTRGRMVCRARQPWLRRGSARGATPAFTCAPGCSSHQHKYSELKPKQIPPERKEKKWFWQCSRRLQGTLTISIFTSILQLVFTAFYLRGSPLCDQQRGDVRGEEAAPPGPARGQPTWCLPPPLRIIFLFFCFIFFLFSHLPSPLSNVRGGSGQPTSLISAVIAPSANGMHSGGGFPNSPVPRLLLPRSRSDCLHGLLINIWPTAAERFLCLETPQGRATRLEPSPLAGKSLAARKPAASAQLIKVSARRLLVK